MQSPISYHTFHTSTVASCNLYVRSKRKNKTLFLFPFLVCSNSHNFFPFSAFILKICLIGPSTGYLLKDYWRRTLLDFGKNWNHFSYCFWYASNTFVGLVFAMYILHLLFSSPWGTYQQYNKRWVLRFFSVSCLCDN